MKKQVQKKCRKRRIAEKVQQVLEDGGVQVELVRAREVPTPHIGVCLFSLLCLLLLPYLVVCITPCLTLSSSLLCGSHGTTAVAHSKCLCGPL